MLIGLRCQARESSTSAQYSAIDATRASSVQPSSACIFSATASAQPRPWSKSRKNTCVLRMSASQTEYASSSVTAHSTWAMIAVPTPDGIVDVLVLNPHVPCREQEAARQEALDRVAAWIRDAQDAGDVFKPGTPIIVAGDLND